MLRYAVRSLVLLCGASVFANDRIGTIEFFGYKGVDIAKVRKTLPVQEGGTYTNEKKAEIRQAIVRVLGKEPTDIAVICCDPQGNRLLYIGLPGASSKAFQYNSPPSGTERLSPEIISIYDRLDHAIEAAVRRGGSAAAEDDSKGYALIEDPSARALQLQVHDWALKHEHELIRVLEQSSAVQDRRIASDALGYAQESPVQILALVQAASDPDENVRNNATRALGVLLRSKPALATEVPAGKFINMLNSGIWTDRNKSCGLLMQLSASRSPDLLAQIRAAALDSLIEMARWREAGHAYFARVVLGRVGGMPEDQLEKTAWTGPVDLIVGAAKP